MSLDNFLGNELTTRCSQLKMVSMDGKKYAGVMTDHIDDREMFTKGIDYSYYYEQED